MNTSPSFFTKIGSALDRLWRFWMDDIRRRRTLAGKVASISIGLFAICCACSVPMAILSPSRSTNQTAQAGRQVASNSGSAALDEEATTETSEPTPEQSAPTATQKQDVVVTEYPMLREPSAFADAIGTVCPGDQVTYLEQHEAAILHYFRVRIEATGEACDARRVPVGEEGWVVDTALTPPSVGVAAVPSTTPEPTTTPRPTRTPLPPTPTPDPADVAAQAYVADVRTQITAISRALQELGELSQSPQFGDQDWIMQMALQTVLIEEGHRQLTELTPPGDAGELHASVLDATSDCAGAMDPLRRGIDALDTALIGQATELMQSCGAKIQLAVPQMEAYVQEHQ